MQLWLQTGKSALRELSVEGSVECSVCAKQLSLGPVGLGVLPGHVGECSSGDRIF